MRGIGGIRINSLASPPPAQDDGDLRCAYHPDTPTRLRCGRCGKPVCTRCVTTTSVGLRCRDCARTQPIAQYQTSPDILAPAIAAGAVSAIVIGAAWGYLIDAGLGPRAGVDWSFWFCLLLGFGVAESISRAAKRRRGPNLRFLGIGAVLLGFVVSRVVLNLRLARPVPLASFLSQPIPAAQLLRVDLLTILFVALACAIAWVRFR